MKNGTNGTLHWVKADDLMTVSGEGKTLTITDLSADVTLLTRTTTRDASDASIADLLKSGEYAMSVVIPLYNEVDNLDALYARLKPQLEITAPNHEIIFVDDGSRDKSFDKLCKIWDGDRSVKVLKLRCNSGKAAALTAGFEHVEGDIVLMMDADLQDQPEEMPRLIAKMDEGYDLVTGWKLVRHDPIHKTWPSKLFNKTIANYFKLDIHDFNCGYKIMKAPVARSLKLYGDYHRFIPVLAANKGYRVAEQAVEHAPRVAGVSKYGAKRLITGMLDFWSSIIVTRFRNKPMQLFGAFGLLLISLGILTGVDLIVTSIMQHGAHDRPLWVVMALLIISGIQMIGTGLLGELIIGIQNRKDTLYDLSHHMEHQVGPL